MIAVVLTLGWIYARHALMPEESVVLAATNGPRTLLLPDSSQITLAPHSTLSYAPADLKKGLRRFQLEGKGYFKVHHDEQHPFSVETITGIVRVLGTVFQVDERLGRGTEVTVESGRVLVALRQHEREGRVLTRGMKAVMQKGLSSPSLAEEDQDASLNDMAWATHTFHFNQTPLVEVLQQLRSQLGINLKAERTDRYLSGEFEVSNAAEAKEVLEAALGIKLTIAQ